MFLKSIGSQDFTFLKENNGNIFEKKKIKGRFVVRSLEKNLKYVDFF